MSAVKNYSTKWLDNLALKDHLQEYLRCISAGKSIFSYSADRYPIFHLLNKHPFEGRFEISKDAIGNLIIFGGGGAHSSAGVFYRLINSFGKYGVSVVALEYPFHGKGPEKEAFFDRDYYYQYIKYFVQQYINTKKPTFLLGQSLGTIVIDRLLRRYSDLDVKGIFLVAPGGPLTSALAEQYNRIHQNGSFDSYLKMFNIQLNKKGRKWMHSILDEPYNTSRLFQGPALVIRGDQDFWSTNEQGQELSRCYPNGSFKVYTNIHHAITLSSKLNASSDLCIIKDFFRISNLSKGKRLAKCKVCEVEIIRFGSSLFQMWLSEQALIFKNNPVKDIECDWKIWIQQLIIDIFLESINSLDMRKKMDKILKKVPGTLQTNEVCQLLKPLLLFLR